MDAQPLPLTSQEGKLDEKEKEERRHLQHLASVIINYPDGKGVVWLQRDGEHQESGLSSDRQSLDE